MEMLEHLANSCRNQARKGESKRGLVVTWWLRDGIPVEVSDVSRFGARLKLVSPTKLPPTFELWLDDDGSVHPSRICWRLCNQFGVEFRVQLAAASKLTHAERSRGS